MAFRYFPGNTRQLVLGNGLLTGWCLFQDPVVVLGLVLIVIEGFAHGIHGELIE